MARSIKVDFYRVEMPASAGVTFQHILQTAAASPDDVTRNRTINGYPYRLCQASNATVTNIYDVEMIRIRMDELPVKASLSGEVEPFDLEDDEGIGEETAFLYHVPTRVLVLQRNRFGVSASAIARYFAEQGGLDAPIWFDPVLKLDAVDQIVQMGIIRKFDIRFAKVDNPQAFGDDHSLDGIMDILHDFSAPSASVAFSMGHWTGSLNVQNIIKLSKRLFRIARADSKKVSRIEVTGRTNVTDEDQVIDLLDFRLQEECDIELDEHRNLSYESRRDALRQILRKNLPALNRMFAGQDNEH